MNWRPSGSRSCRSPKSSNSDGSQYHHRKRRVRCAGVQPGESRSGRREGTADPHREGADGWALQRGRDGRRPPALDALALPDGKTRRARIAQPGSRRPPRRRAARGDSRGLHGAHGLGRTTLYRIQAYRHRTGAYPYRVGAGGPGRAQDKRQQAQRTQRGRYRGTGTGVRTASRQREKAGERARDRPRRLHAGRPETPGGSGNKTGRGDIPLPDPRRVPGIAVPI